MVKQRGSYARFGRVSPAWIAGSNLRPAAVNFHFPSIDCTKPSSASRRSASGRTESTTECASPTITIAEQSSMEFGFIHYALNKAPAALVVTPSGGIATNTTGPISARLAAKSSSPTDCEMSWGRRANEIVRGGSRRMQENARRRTQAGCNGFTSRTGGAMIVAGDC